MLYHAPLGSELSDLDDRSQAGDQTLGLSSLDREAFGDYVIQKSLGRGAFGEVYLAEHRFIKRTFALKVLPPHVCSDLGFMRRFEAKVADIAALDHPHIVKIHNVSSCEGCCFLVMDPIVDSLGETMNLDRYLALKGKSLSEADLEALLMQVASALDHAHASGVVHGSLKLTNILVVASEPGVKLLLSDFGLNRWIGEGISFLRLCEEAAKTLMSRTPASGDKAQQMSRTFVRNFSFLAPEQKDFHEYETDAKVDAFSFGILAYFLLTGKTPEGCFELPSKLAADLKKNWDLLIHRCLQSNPHARPQKFVQAMHEYLSAPRCASKETSQAVEGDSHLDSIFQMSFEFPKEHEAAKST
ncbi:MAG TPA: hypothetical protein DCE71_05140, partial [Parachlamydiales bacterium]|nr:hypothetical protein [Parachlamydiales bacterium]